MRPAIYLSPTKESTALRGHPWIFPKAIARTQGSLKTGQLVDIYTSKAQPFALGIYNEHSLYRVRILAYHRELEQANTTLNSIIELRLQQAWRLRQNLGFPNSATNAFRLLNSEADGLSGLTLDYFNGDIAVSSSAYWVMEHQAMIEDSIKKIIPCKDVFWFPQLKPLKQDGWHEIQDNVYERSVEVLEAGVRFKIDFHQTQKTGLFLDQRDNHQRIAALAQGKKVLDLYCYTGGFALHAGKAGATVVTAVDSSEPAILQARINVALNQLKNVNCIVDDARLYLENAKDYDLIILDPPKLIPSKHNLEKAKNYYRFLHRELFKHMRSGSLLMTCNCSSAINPNDFAMLVSMQASAMEKQVRILGVYGPAICHPISASFPEGNYLTAVLLAVI